MSCTIPCTAPWDSIYLQSNRVSVCCYLAFASSYVQPTQQWEAWDRFEDVIRNSAALVRLRNDMRAGLAQKVCTAQTRCSACHFNPNVDTTSDVLHPTSLTVDVTNRCQSRCYYCYRWHPSKRVLPEEPTLAQVERFMSDVQRLGFTELWYAGGDPLIMDDDKLALYMAPLETAGVSIHTFTNGIGLTPERWKRWFSHQRSYVQVTLDTMDQRLYSKTRGECGADTIHSQLRSVLTGQDVSRIRLTCTITTATLDSVADVIRFAHELGIREVVPNPVAPSTSCLPAGENIFAAGTAVETLKKARQCADSWKALSQELGVSLVCLQRFYSTLEVAERRAGVQA